MNLNQLLSKREFISVATCDLRGQPNAAPKLLLSADEKFIYLIDYTVGKTWENLRINPKVSLSLSDIHELKGYRINGTVEIIDQGPLYKKLAKEFEERKIVLSVERVISGVQRQQRHRDFEMAIPEKFVIFKVKIQDVTEINPQGKLKKTIVDGSSLSS